MSIKKYVRNKHTIITSRLARAFLMAKEGDSIPTINDYSQIFGVGSGTVQSALQQLKTEKAIEVEAKGFLGTYITKLDYKKLWELSEFGVLLGLLPLGSRVEIRNIAKKIRMPFEEQNIQMHISFMPGSINRVQTLVNEKCDFIVMSEYSFTKALEKRIPIEKVINLGSNNYYSDIGILHKGKENLNGNKKSIIAGNQYSFDHNFIVELIGESEDIEFCHMDMEEITINLIKGKIDGAIIDRRELSREYDKFQFTQIHNLLKHYPEDLMKPIMAVREDDNELRKILAKKLSLQFKKDKTIGASAPQLIY